MKDIKFRAWHIDSKLMFDVLAIAFQKQQIVVKWHGAERAIDINQFDLMLYTGMKDKKRIDICEGDIIEATERRYFLGHEKGLQTIRFKSAVVFEDAGFVYSTTQENDSPLFNTDDIIVIGNIHQNPELLHPNTL